MENNKQIMKFIGKAKYYDLDQMIWGEDERGGNQLLADVRGWGAIQNLFSEGGSVNLDKASKFQDDLGKFIVDAINEKIERDNA